MSIRQLLAEIEERAKQQPEGTPLPVGEYLDFMLRLLEASLEVYGAPAHVTLFVCQGDAVKMRTTLDNDGLRSMLVGLCDAMILKHRPAASSRPS
jgi:hypothetical protein